MSTNQKHIDLAREIVTTLVHLKEVPEGVPEHGRKGYQSIREAYAIASTSTERGPDPLLSSAEAWVVSKLEEADAPKGKKAGKDDAPEAAQTPPGAPSEDEEKHGKKAHVHHGAVVVEEDEKTKHGHASHSHKKH